MEYYVIVFGWLAINVFLFLIAAKCLDSAAFSYAGFLLLGEILITGIIIMICSPHPEPHYTGEIIKFYANGTVLVDNGTVMPWPYGGCGK